MFSAHFSGFILPKLRLLSLQSAKEYYEQTLMQELKKNQELQEYIRLLENRLYTNGKECRLDKQVNTSRCSAVIHFLNSFAIL